MLQQGPRSHRNDEEEWEIHRERLRRLYIDENKPRKEVMSIMSKQYGFHKPSGFYERYFKKWGFRKNRESHEWRILAMKLAERKALGKASIVFCDGKQLSDSKVQKRTSHNSYSMESMLHEQGTTPATPTAFSILTPPIEDREPIFTDNLPFRMFQASTLVQGGTPANRISVNLDDFHSESDPAPLQPVSAQRTIPMTSQELRMLEDTAKLYGTVVLPTLRSLLPSIMIADSPQMSSTVRLPLKTYEKEHIKLLCFSAANNFAALEEFPIENIWKYLRTKVHLPDLVRVAPGPTMNSLIEKLFTSALVGSDTKTVEFLLTGRYIDVNEHICTLEDYQRYTPVELSAFLQDISMTNLLVSCGADVNKTLGKQGALNCAILRDTHVIVSQRRPPDPLLIETLLSHGAKVTSACLAVSMRLPDPRVVEKLILAGAHDIHHVWKNDGFFAQAVNISSIEASTNIVKVMLEVGADLNAKLIYSGEVTVLVDVVAQKGSLSLVQLLLDSGAQLTESTLTSAIKSGNNDLAFYILGKGANPNSLRSDRYKSIGTILYETPFSEAIRTGSESLMNHFKNAGALNLTNDRHHFQAATVAAADVGELHTLEILIQLHPVGFEEELGLAFCTALEQGHEDLAHLLIDSGAEIRSTYYRNSKALYEALRRNWKELVHKLIDVVSVRSTEDKSSDSRLLKLATEQGDVEIVKSLIYANFKPHGALSIAVLKGNTEIIRLLLNYGANIDSCDGGQGSLTPLSAAVMGGDLCLLRFLIEEGADPWDEEALFKAASKGKEFVSLLLDEFVRRYPKGGKGYGTKTLVKAAKDNDIALLETILRAKPSVGQVEPDSNMAPLAAAIRHGNLAILQRFLDTGVDLNTIVLVELRARNMPERQTPLIVAIISKRVEVAQLLIAQGADVNLAATKGLKRTPLQMAGQIGSLELVRVLIKNGANVNGEPAYSAGATALQYAAIGGFIGVAEELLKRGADVNAAPSKVHGRTAIEGAIENGRIDMVRYLLNAGATLELPRHPQYEKAKQRAKDHGHRALCQMLDEIFDAGQ